MHDADVGLTRHSPSQFRETPLVSDLRIRVGHRHREALLVVLSSPINLPHLCRLVLADWRPESELHNLSGFDTHLEALLDTFIAARLDTGLEYLGVLEHCRVSCAWALSYPGLVEVLPSDCSEAHELRPRGPYSLR